MRETKGEAVSATELLNNRFTCLQNSAVSNCQRGPAARKGLGEVSCKNHGIKAWESGVAACKKFSKYREAINLRIPHRGTASLAQVSTMGLCPLHLTKALWDRA